MGTLTRDQINFAAGRSAAALEHWGYEANRNRLQAAASVERENQMILDSARRAAGTPRRDPDQPTRVRVLVPFALDGGIAQVDSIVSLPLFEAEAQARIGRAEIA